ncbi:MAG: DMT family transporter [Acidimicrobiales bacterium]
MSTRRQRRLAHLALVVASLFFGTTFVVVKRAVADMGAFPFLGLRFCLAAAILWPFARRRPASPGEGAAGGLCGLALLTGYVLQTIGLEHLTATASAFITYLLVVFVPLIWAVVARRRPEVLGLGGGAVALAGLFLLGRARPSLGLGELLTLGCALAFALHIVLLARLAPRHDPLRLTTVQLGVVGVGCGLPGLLEARGASAGALAGAAYTAVVASALAFSLMVWAQRRVDPGRTALLLMLEPVFAAGVGYLAGDRLGWLQAAGAGMILLGVSLAEVDLGPERVAAPGRGPSPAPLRPP